MLLSWFSLRRSSSSSATCLRSCLPVLVQLFRKFTATLCLLLLSESHRAFSHPPSALNFLSWWMMRFWWMEPWGLQRERVGELLPCSLLLLLPGLLPRSWCLEPWVLQRERVPGSEVWCLEPWVLQRERLLGSEELILMLTVLMLREM
jgi:hypothetical protein